MIADRISQSLFRRIFNPATGLILIASIGVSSCQTRLPDQLPPEAKVTVLFSDQSKAEKQLLTRLKKRLGKRMKKYHARGYRRQDNRLIRQYAKVGSGQIVAIGRRAALLAKKIKNKSVIYSRVYNVSSVGLTGERFSGVSVVPDPESVLWTVRSLNPSIKSLGVVTGPGLDQIIARIKYAAANKKIRLIHRVVKTDKEFLYVANQISKDVDAYWLLPDERILSGVAIETFMSRTVKQGKQVIVFTVNLLKLGALVSVEPNQDAVADLLHNMVLSDYYRKKESERGMQYVKKMKISISQLSANRLGVLIPKSLQRYRYE